MHLNSVPAVDSGGSLSISLHLRLLVHYVFTLDLYMYVYHLWIVESQTKRCNINQIMMARFGYIRYATRTTPTTAPSTGRVVLPSRKISKPATAA